MPYPETTDAFTVTSIKDWSNFKRQEVSKRVSPQINSLLTDRFRFPSRSSRRMILISLSMLVVFAHLISTPSRVDGERIFHSRFA
jgi:hypothetical protein